MKKIIFLMVFLLSQGCAIYPPYGPGVAYNSYSYGHSPRHYGGGRNQGWGGGHHRWGGGHYHD
jgi:hypothetical protein